MGDKYRGPAPIRGAVLRRRLGQTVEVQTADGVVRITLVEVCTARAVKIAVEAPPQCGILRGELVGREQPAEGGS